jgi:hypothetical protein
MNENQVIENVLIAFEEFKSTQSSPFWCGMILHCSTTLDDPLSVSKIAELAVHYFTRGDAICGFGFYGREVINLNFHFCT